VGDKIIWRNERKCSNHSLWNQETVAELSRLLMQQYSTRWHVDKIILRHYWVINVANKPSQDDNNIFEEICAISSGHILVETVNVINRIKIKIRLYLYSCGFLNKIHVRITGKRRLQNSFVRPSDVSFCHRKASAVSDFYSWCVRFEPLSLSQVNL
jgi:hypothetical protein